MENRTIIKRNASDLHEVKNISNIIDSLFNLSDINDQDRSAFFDGIKQDIDSIVVTNETFAEVLKDLILYKQKLQFKKTPPARTYEIKRINEALSLLIEPTIHNLSELIRLEKDHGVTNDNKPIINEANPGSTEPVLDSINSNLSELDQDPEINLTHQKIKLNIPKEKVYKHFIKLANFKNELNNQPYLSAESVERLLAQTIEGYSSECLPHCYFDLNITAKQLRRFYVFIYQFYQMNEVRYTGTKQKYAELLKNNFSNFKDHDVKSIYTTIRLDSEEVATIDLLK